MARPRGNRKTARLTVSLDDRAYAALCVLARQRDVSVAWMVRRAVDDLVQRQAAALAEPELPLPRSTAAAAPKAHG